MSADPCGTGGFTFVWTILDWSHYVGRKKGFALNSAEFFAVGTTWRLCLHPRGKSGGCGIACSLKKSRASLETEVTIDCVVCVYTVSGERLGVDRRERVAFARLSNGTHTSVFNRPAHLPGDALVVHCHLWRGGSDRTEAPSLHCHQLTHLRVQKKVFFWNVEAFGSLPPGEERVFHVPPVEKGCPALTFELSVGGSTVHEAAGVRVAVAFEGMSAANFLTCSISVLGRGGTTVKVARERLWLKNGGGRVMVFPHLIGREELMQDPTSCLPGDVLALKCEVALSRPGPLYSVGQVIHGQSTPAALDLFRKRPLSAFYVPPDPPHTLTNDLGLLFESGALADLELSSACGRAFPAHALLLGARSPVFRNMFRHDMLEKRSGCLRLPDLDPDTLHRMLRYVYTDAVPDLGWEDAALLYYAADKYQLLGLRRACLALLGDRLDLANAAQVLALADRHGDSDLKRAVREFVCGRPAAVDSEGWRFLEEENPKLALETMRHILCEKVLVPTPQASEECGRSVRTTENFADATGSNFECGLELSNADRLGDSDLKKAVQEFVFSRGGAAAFHSEGWRLLEEENPHLALETLRGILLALPPPGGRDQCGGGSGFTFVWTFENFRQYLPRVKTCRSAEVIAFGGAWHLQVWPRGRWGSVEICLRGRYPSQGAPIACEMCLCTTDGERLAVDKKEEISFAEYSKGKRFAFKKRPILYPTPDMLVVHCHLWKGDPDNAEMAPVLCHQLAHADTTTPVHCHQLACADTTTPVHCHQLACADTTTPVHCHQLACADGTRPVHCHQVTRLHVQKTKFRWNIGDFSPLSLGVEREFFMPPVEGTQPALLFQMSLVGATVEEAWVQMRIRLQFPVPEGFFVWSFSVVDREGNKLECPISKWSWRLNGALRELDLQLTRKQLVSERTACLPGDVLTLECEVTFCDERKREIEQVVHGLSTRAAVDLFHRQLPSLPPRVPHRGAPHTLRSDLGLLYEDGAPYDLELSALGGRAFSAHRLLLCARSSVLMKLFQNDPLEKTPCIPPDTLDRMLRYVYTDAAPEMMGREEAERLYTVAGEYQLENLRQWCAVVLEEAFGTRSLGQGAVPLLESGPDLEGGPVGLQARDEEEGETEESGGTLESQFVALTLTGA